MAIVERGFDPTRRDFLALGFARRRRGGGQPPRRPDSGSSSPQPPDFGNWFHKKVNRREALGLGVLAATLAGGGYIAHKLGWLFPTTPDQTQKEPETLEDMVAEAKSMEEEFKGRDLSDKESRDQYAELLVNIFVRYYPLGVSKLELQSSIIWFDSKEEYEELFISRNQDPFFSQDYLRQVAASRPAFTGSNDGKIYVNATHEIFQRERTSTDKFPQDWNPLKSLRLTLFHEFSHKISDPSKDPTVFSVVDASNTLTDQTIEGFQIRGFNNKRELLGIYNPIDEASVELLSKYINTDLFHSFVSDYGDRQGNNVTAIMTRLEQLLSAAQITKMDLARLHKASNLKGFLLLLAERGGINPQRISEPDRIAFGFSLFEALIRNNQVILQDYMNSARR